jgi:hypothetical protein
MRYAPGDLVEIIEAGDQSLYIKTFRGKAGILIKNLGPPEIMSSKRLWETLVEGKVITLHELDFELLVKKNERQ